MKLAVSNLAWPAGADAEAADILARHGATGVELAPGKVWPKPVEATDDEIVAVRRWWEDRGFRVASFQALVFGRPDLLIFGEPEVRERFVEYLSRIVRLAGKVGAGPLVFGSPKNRAVDSRPWAEYWPVAVEFFRRVGTIAAEHGTILGIENVPPVYGADFVNTVAEAAELVRAVDSPGFGAHVDAGGLTMTGDDLGNLGDVRPVHFHISEPNLAPIGSTPAVPHAKFAAGLWAMNYGGWVSIEVKQPPADWQTALEQSLIAAKVYS